MIRTLFLFGAVAIALVLLSRMAPMGVDDLIEPSVETWIGDAPWSVGVSDDSFSYDGRHVRRIEGKAAIHLGSTPQESRLTVWLPVSPGGRLLADTVDVELELRFSLDAAEMLLSDRVIHSGTGQGDRRLPETFARHAGAGPVELWIDGEYDRTVDGFWALADAVRRADGSIRNQGLVFSPLLRDRTVFSDPERLEITVLLYEARGSEVVVLHLVFPVTR